MKEQVITPRAGRGVGASKGRAGEIVQRPAARRGRGATFSSSSSARAKSNSWGKVLAYLPLAAKIAIPVVAGVLLFAGYRAAASASFFQARNVDVSGTSRASAEEIRAVVKRDVAQSGVWRADLDAISRELKNVAWVRDAVVSRVLPDGLRVRVTERAPRAVIRTSVGKLLWVDDEAVTLGTMLPNDKMPRFFVSGWNEAGTSAAQAENRERIQMYLAMLGEWETLGIAERISEVNLNDLHDVRVQLAGNDSLIDISLGKEKFGDRLSAVLRGLDDQRKTSLGPLITHIVASTWMKSGDVVVFGYDRNAPNSSGSSSGNNTENEVARVNKEARNAEREKATTRGKKVTEESKRKGSEPRKKEHEKSPKADASKSETRSRRVG